MSSLEPLIAAAQRRWAIPILATLHRDQGAKLVTLCHRVVQGPDRTATSDNLQPANQGAVRQALDHLIELGWVQRNSGYGHPLRPEYILARPGERLAPAAAIIDDAIFKIRAHDLALRRWALPILRVAFDEGPARFSALTAALRPATDRAISLTLQSLSAGGAIDRSVGASDAWSAAAAYVVTPPFRSIARAAQGFS